jgi:hypothetical protein
MNGKSVVKGVHDDLQTRTAQRVYAVRKVHKVPRRHICTTCSDRNQVSYHNVIFICRIVCLFKYKCINLILVSMVECECWRTCAYLLHRFRRSHGRQPVGRRVCQRSSIARSDTTEDHRAGTFRRTAMRHITYTASVERVCFHPADQSTQYHRVPTSDAYRKYCVVTTRRVRFVRVRSAAASRVWPPTKWSIESPYTNVNVRVYLRGRFVIDYCRRRCARRIRYPV